MQVRYTPRYEGGTLAGVEVEIRDRGLVRVDPDGRLIRQVSYIEEEGRKHVAVLVDERVVVLWRTDDGGSEHQAAVSVAADQHVTEVRIGRGGVVVAGTDRGRLYRWSFEDDVPELTDVSPVAEDEIAALEFLIGGNSVVVGTSRGEVSSWFRAPLPRAARPWCRRTSSNRRRAPCGRSPCRLATEASPRWETTGRLCSGTRHRSARWPGRPAPGRFPC